MKAKVNLTLDVTLWQDFRVECLKRQTSASSEIEEFISARLAEWKKQKGGESKKK